MNKKSKKIKVRNTSRVELDYVIELESSPENRKNVFQWSEKKHREIIDNPDTDHLIIEDENGNKIGYAIIAGLQSNNRSIELRRVVIDKKNQGYGTEFLNLIKEYTFEDLRYHKLWLDFFSTNQRVESLYKRNGFKREGKLRDKYFYNNRYITMVVMSILEDEYFKEM
ncbi:MAG: GNAT family N-acetyltransferase [Halanaerobiales bacterium]|nr:GNAT family N-acetyltransferase [Halanaerobiales bacterium]